MNAHLVLTGPRAVGKSTMGRALAEAWSCPFIDLDVHVLDSFDEQTLIEVWGTHGESAWRAAEMRSLVSVLAQPPSVIALGGGVPTIPEAAERLNASRRDGTSWIVWLKADPVILASRLSSVLCDRPSLTGQSPEKEIADICAAREDAYRCISDMELDVGTLDLQSAVQRIQSRAFNKTTDPRSGGEQG